MIRFGMGLFILVLVLVLVLFLFIMLFFKYKNNNEGFDSFDVVIVISRYNENLDWLKEAPFNKYPVIIYNKGINDDFYKPKKSKIMKLENIGRCDHTYLYHIIENYDKLNNIIIFMPGSTNMPYKMEKAIKLFKLIEENKKAVFLSEKAKLTDLYDFQLDNWKASSSENNSINAESNLELATIRPFGKWYESKFGNVELEHISYGGIHSISKHDILQHPKSYYENLIKDVSNSSNPEAGHYFERSWETVFSMKHTMIIENN